eukprot:TRINITY_DN657_c0_g2_i1.p2 TRINITY_DN657_c0_g2~~TRINITY_DN657_c0_g2_i1.p2  ORF type:complete len:214 (+),score=57.88 TRINITY_DN657_c0_g2_i1:1209-1850(+)
MLNKIKGAAQSAKTAAGLETSYLQRKAKGNFPHEGEVGTHVQILQGIKNGSNLREKISSLVDKSKSMNEAQNKAGTDFTVVAGETNDPNWAALGSIYTDLSNQRVQLIDTLHSVKEEWKSFESGDLKKVVILEDQANRLLSDSLYYGSHDDANAKATTDEKYTAVTQQLVAGVQELHAKHAELYAKWTKTILSAEVGFYTAALQIVSSGANKL